MVYKSCTWVFSGLTKSRTFILRRMPTFISEELAISIYSSLIDPHFADSDVIYDGCTKACSIQLQVQQNMALRSVLNVDSRYPTQSLHDRTGIDWLHVTRKNHCCIEAYKGINDISPTTVSNLFNLYKPTQCLRSSDKINFVQPRTKTAFADNNLVNRSYRYWQSLPDEIRAKPSLSSCKPSLKKGDFLTHIR